MRSLQDRLQETEALLLGVLNRLPDDELSAALQQEKGSSHQTWTSSMSGQDYWSCYPLNRLDSVRQWQKSRTSQNIQANSSEHVHKEGAPGWALPDAPQEIKVQAADSANLPPGFDQAPPAVMQTQVYDWPGAQEPAIASRDERYSEEARDVAQTLFSISNQGNALPRDQLRSTPPQMHGNVTTSPDLETLPSRFPKHLFW